MCLHILGLFAFVGIHSDEYYQLIGELIFLKLPRIVIKKMKHYQFSASVLI